MIITTVAREAAMAEMIKNHKRPFRDLLKALKHAIIENMAAMGCRMKNLVTTSDGKSSMRVPVSNLEIGTNW